MGRKYKLRYLPLALADLLDIAAYIRENLHAPQAATELIDKLGVAISRLERFPHSGHPYVSGKLQDSYRRLVVGNYLIFYVVNEEEGIVEIRRIMYGKRYYDKLL